VLWSDLYLRYVVDQSNAKQRFDAIQSLITQEKELRSKVLKLRRQLIDICKEMETIPDDLTE
jgi:myotubularin-related protein 9